ncbi:MAG: MDR family MFS transporter [Anaerovorax sp.]
MIKNNQEITKQSGGVTRRDIVIIAIVVAGAFVAILNQTILSPALPKLMETFHITAGKAQWVTTIYMLVNGIMVPITAYLIDRFPTRKLFMTSMIVFMVGTALVVVAPNFSVLIMARILQAMGAGVQLPLVAVVPMLIFPREKRGTAMGMAGIVMSCAPAAGPVVAGWAIDAFGWRSIFIGMLPLAFLVLVFSMLFLTNVGTLKHPHLDLISVVLSTFAFGGLLYGLSSASTKGWASALVIAPLLIGVVALVCFIKRQLTLKEPLLELKVLKTKTFTYSAIMNTIINSALAAGSILLPIYLQNIMGFSAFITGMLMMPGAAITIFMSPISGLLFDHFGPRGISILGLTSLTVATAGLAIIGTETKIWYLIFIYILQSFGLSLANMPINTWGINSLPNDYISHGNAISNTGRQVGGSIGTAVIITIMTMVTNASNAVSPVLAAVSGIRAAYGTSAGIAAVALFIAIFKVHGTVQENHKVLEKKEGDEIHAKSN